MSAGKRGTRTRDAAPDILARISRGESLSAACKANGLARSGFIELCEKDKDVAEQYARARVDCLELHAEQILDIADNPTGDYNRDRLRVDSRKWLLSKLLPKKYGDKLDLNHGGRVTMELTTEQTDAALRASGLVPPLAVGKE